MSEKPTIQQLRDSLGDEGATAWLKQHRAPEVIEAGHDYANDVRKRNDYMLLDRPGAARNMWRRRFKLSTIEKFRWKRHRTEQIAKWSPIKAIATKSDWTDADQRRLESNIVRAGSAA